MSSRLHTDVHIPNYRPITQATGLHSVVLITALQVTAAVQLQVAIEIVLTCPTCLSALAVSPVPKSHYSCL